MTIRAILYGVLAALGLLILVLSGLGGADAWREWRAANAAYKTNMATDLLLAAGRDVVAGRDALVRGQHSGHGDMPGKAMKMKSDTGGNGGHSNHGEDAFGQAMARLHDLQDWSGRQALMDELHRQKQSFDTSAMTGSGDQAAVMKNAGILLRRMEDLRLSSVRMSVRDDAVAGTYSMMKHFSQVILDYVSRERLAVAGFIADDMPIPPHRLPDLFGWRGRVELAWQALEEAAASGLGGSQMAGEIGKVRRNLFGTFDKLRSDIYEAGMTGQRYGIVADQWLSNSGEAIALVVDLQKSIVAANEVHAEVQANAALRNMVFYGVLLALGFAVGCFSIVLVARRISGPVNKMTLAMTRLAEGDTDVRLPVARRGDEIGRMAQAVLVFRDNAVEKRRLEAEQAAAEARLREERRSAMMAMADRFEAEVRELVDAVSSSSTELEATARGLSGMADEASQQSATVASASGQVSANVRTVATATEELSASIAEIARRIGSSARIAGEAVDQASQTNEVVDELQAVTGRIGEIVTMISEIAGQTNLLALNATIEAARAGEAGKGFAVVAQEVKNLANQTAKATEEVGAQVAAVQQRSRGTAEAITGIVSVVEEIGKISSEIAVAVEQQGASTDEIARNVQHAARGTQEVAKNIESVNNAAGETGRAAGRVLEASESLLDRSEKLRSEVDRFLAEVRAA